MRVGIITRHAISNYGSILQAYATEKIIKKIGYDATIIDYIRYDEKAENIVDTYANSSNFFGKNRLTKFLYKSIQGKNLYCMDYRFAEFRKDFLTLTKECNTLEELKEMNNKFDIFCTGSDQVWGKIGNEEFDENYFLSFVDKNKKCISYASSFGKTVFNEEFLNKIKTLTNKYKTLLVREDSAVEFLKKNGIDSKQVLDPTLLLDKKEWEALLNDNEKKIKNKYILVYQLHHNKEFEKYVKNIQKKFKIHIYRINPSIYFALKPGKFIYLPNPKEFLNLIKNAETVLTDSFHGTIFSIIFNKEFIDFIPKLTGTRIISLLNLFGLNDRIVSDSKDFDIIRKKIDYKKVNQILVQERKKSIRLLEGVLSEK